MVKYKEDSLMVHVGARFQHDAYLRGELGPYTSGLHHKQAKTMLRPNANLITVENLLACCHTMYHGNQVTSEQAADTVGSLHSLLATLRAWTSVWRGINSYDRHADVLGP